MNRDGGDAGTVHPRIEACATLTTPRSQDPPEITGEGGRKTEWKEI
jgi:hypothetical protein